MSDKLFGWVAPEKRTPFQHEQNERILSEMRPFEISGAYRGDEKKAFLWEFSKRLNGGKHIRYIRQVTGSCVGAGGANMLRTLAHVEMANGDPEEWPVEEGWWVWTYGQGRVRAGLNGRGEGSFGSAQAEAFVKDGWFFRNELAGLPDFQRDDSWIVLPQSVEMEWSDGRAKSQHATIGARHLIKTAARLRNSDEAKAALANGYPITIASMFGTRGARATGSPAVQLAEWDDRWAHQMSCHAFWEHPSLGLIFYILNQWGSGAHPAPLQGEPPGGFWVRASTFDMMLSDEGFAFSAFNGFPARELSWYI